MEVRMNARRQINMQFEHMILRILCCTHVRVDRPRSEADAECRLKGEMKLGLVALPLLSPSKHLQILFNPGVP